MDDHLQSCGRHVAADQFSEFLFAQPIESNIVHFVTVPFALIFAWYRYRFELVDVITRQAISLLVIVVVISGGFRFLPTVDASLQPLLGYVLAIVGFTLVRVAGKALYGLWMPPAREQKLFRREFPLQLGQCESAAQAVSLAEQELGRLFQCEVWINRESDGEAARLIRIPETPEVVMELGYIRGIRPWFSAALTIANEAALHLQSTLHVLEWRAIQHRTELNNQALQTLAARAERDAMRAQIRPHFFFNVLNAMHTYVRDDPDQAQYVIELMADLMRGIAQTTDQDTYPLAREIELAHTYLKIERVRYGDRLQFELDVDEELREHPIPPFSIQPLVENAIKYSVDSQLQRARVSVSVKRRLDQLQIVVTDNGPGLDQTDKPDGLGLALENIRDRLDKLYAGRASLRLESAEFEGTLAILTLPWGSPEGDVSQ